MSSEKKIHILMKKSTKKHFSRKKTPPYKKSTKKNLFFKNTFYEDCRGKYFYEKGAEYLPM